MGHIGTKNDFKNKTKKSAAIRCNINDISDGDNSILAAIKNLRRINCAGYENMYFETRDKVSKLKRCVKCILPATMPLIKFDNCGVCNYCLEYKNIQVKGEEALKNIVAKYRSKDGRPDCIIAFSGGRDSSYGLHYLKKVLGMNPIAFTYDWGMVADIARRNQSRLVSKLRVEHVVRAADIEKKRKYIKQNVSAWLKKPDLGMVPLFMAGDKHVEHLITQVAKEYGVKLIFLCRGNQLENEEFKWGYCAIKNGSPNGVIHNLSLWGKIKIALYYAGRYIANPAYINSSLLNTLYAYSVTYMMCFDFIYLWHYIKWDEDKIVSTLKNEYEWETDGDTLQTWRTDDGTSPFYNYIYYTMGGFTENDTFRSNQIREGMLAREDALKIVGLENRPRFDAIKDYLDKIGLDFDNVLVAINSASKRY